MLYKKVYTKERQTDRRYIDWSLQDKTEREKCSRDGVLYTLTYTNGEWDWKYGGKLYNHMRTRLNYEIRPSWCGWNDWINDRKSEVIYRYCVKRAFHYKQPNTCDINFHESKPSQEKKNWWQTVRKSWCFALRWRKSRLCSYFKLR